MRVYTTQVSLVLLESPVTRIPNVRLDLYDRDRLSADDWLGTAVTDDQGDAEFRYTLRQCHDVDEALGGEYPELFVVVYDAARRRVLSTRSEALPNNPRKHVLVRLPRELASAHGLLPSPPPEAGV